MGFALNNQRVGLLLGIVMFLGAMMTAYFDNAAVWSWVSLVTFAFVVWTVARIWRSSTGDAILRGAVIGAMAMVVARLVGLVSTRLLFSEWTVNSPGYDVLSGPITDMQRVILNGSFGQTLILVIASSLLAAAITFGARLLGQELINRRSA